MGSVPKKKITAKSDLLVLQNKNSAGSGMLADLNSLKLDYSLTLSWHGK